MDEHKLEQILRTDMTPAADENARKRAVNLAMAAYAQEQKKKSEKKFQGFSILSRLTGNTSFSGRRETMEKKTYKKLYQGVALMVLGTGLLSTFYIMNNGDYEIIDQGSVGRSASSPTYNYNTVSLRETSQDDALQQWRQPQDEMKLAEAEIDAISPMQPASSEFKKEKAERRLAADKAIAGAGVTAENIAIPASPPVQNVIMPIDPMPQPGYHDEGRDKFQDFDANSFKSVVAEPVSTFSSDVDTASYSFVRRQLDHGVLPQKDAVRVEEMINYFHYNYPVPESREEPFAPSVTVTDSPWAQGKKLMHIGIKGYEITGAKPRSNLVFLLDVSGSMNEQDKLPLLKSSMKMLLDTLNPDDTIAIAVYAGAAGTALEPTKASEKSKIIAAIDNLQAGGSTAGAQGIELAYKLAQQNFDKEAVNRVMLATDGDFNVGITNPEELKDFVERKRETGIFLSVLGFGQGNYNDALMQTLAQNGNGTASYIDSLNEARKVLVDEASSTLFPIAKDVKFQIEFNPKTVAEYRLIGYETRHLNREDFNNDAIDAGDMGAGHTVTAIYEFVPVGSEALSVDPLRYGEKGTAPVPKADSENGEYAFLKIRYKLPESSVSKLITRPVTPRDVHPFCPPGAQCLVAGPSQDVLFSEAVAAFAQILKGGKYTGNFTYDDVIALAQAGKGEDPYGYRAEFIQMVRMAKTLSR